MVKIAIAGGAGNVGQEVLDALMARKKHEIIILSRKDAPEIEIAAGVKWFKTKYDNVEELTKILEGVHTVLSFMSVAPGDTAAGPQEKLIDAAVRAGVKRFAPSEWASSNLDYFPWYDFKRSAREYLAELNKDKKVPHPILHPVICLVHKAIGSVKIAVLSFAVDTLAYPALSACDSGQPQFSGHTLT
ncbi:hypothetical protein DER44DRAFT_834230 [Fusarium oxysporum]|nr:hypothetical protein DER44DRAFT_834230 [Fusarium oxysporum]